MKPKSAWTSLLGAAALAVVLYPANQALATDPVGYTKTPIVQGRFEAIDVANSFVPVDFPKHTNVWVSFQRTKYNSDLYVQNNMWAPGGSTGWHSHPGHSLIIVTQGTVTAYEGDDPNCTPHVYTVGMTFVDKGGTHVHIVRNETAAPAATIAVQLIPANQSARSDAPDPGNCHFPN
jgi:quercetin dioxygenase-like cupin family protein